MNSISFSNSVAVIEYKLKFTSSQFICAALALTYIYCLTHSHYNNIAREYQPSLHNINNIDIIITMIIIIKAMIFSELIIHNW